MAPSSERVAGLSSFLGLAYVPGMSSNRTIQGMIDGGYKTRAYCHNSKCGHHAEIDWLALRAKLGPGFVALGSPFDGEP